mmetsp:Transcript_17900/g.46844  ORF Transcript_17900/g.46844 Transcript_17900/m.46844 type:complete len:368 (+) Transcript_17900:2168-3271(+)
MIKCLCPSTKGLPHRSWGCCRGFFLTRLRPAKQHNPLMPSAGAMLCQDPISLPLPWHSLCLFPAETSTPHPNLTKECCSDTRLYLSSIEFQCWPAQAVVHLCSGRRCSCKKHYAIYAEAAGGGIHSTCRPHRGSRASRLEEAGQEESTILLFTLQVQVGAYIAPADPTEEVEPQELKELVKSLPVAQHTLQIGSIEVMDAVTGNSESPMLLVDVRSEEEVLVSTIPGAIHCPAEKDDSLPHGWSADMDKLKKHLALLAVLPGGAATAAAVDAARSGTEAGVAESKPMRIVAFCNTGERSGASSIMMTEKVGLPVRSLCGGILNYYNQGGSVCDVQGHIVQAVHPGVPPPDLQHLVVRPNNFKLHHDS